jgi:hypothetical protein
MDAGRYVLGDMLYVVFGALLALDIVLSILLGLFSGIRQDRRKYLGNKGVIEEAATE